MRRSTSIPPRTLAKCGRLAIVDDQPCLTKAGGIRHPGFATTVVRCEDVRPWVRPDSMLARNAGP